MLDDTLLADPRALAALDTGGVLRSAATAGAQVRSTAHAAQEVNVAALSGHRPRALVLLRRAGAATPAFVMLAALLGPMCPVPVVLSEAVPSWIGPLDVVVAHTADASDGDLAESVGRAVARGAEVVLSAPGDGPVASAGAGRVRLVEPRIPVPPGLDLPRALAVGLPPNPPLRLPPLTIRGEQIAVAASGDQVPEGRITEVMDKHVLCTDDPKASLAHAHRVVIVLQQADLKLLIDRSDALVDIPPHRQAEHRQHADVEKFAFVRSRIFSGEPHKLAVGAVGYFDLCLVTDAVGDRANQPDTRVL